MASDKRLRFAAIERCGTPSRQSTPVLAAMMLLCSCSGGEVRAVNDALGEVAPGLSIGDFAAPHAERLGLRIAPYVGYGDTSLLLLPSFRTMWLVLDSHSELAHVPPPMWARIRQVSFEDGDSSAAVAMEAALTSRYGEPLRYCPATDGPQRRELRFWPRDARFGVLLRHYRDPENPGAIYFGSEQPDLAPCPTGS